MVPGMIDRDYFKRQARTLRKMVRVAQDRTVADRLSDMADDFEARANDGSARLEHGCGPPWRGADRDEGPG
jgi:hypothetical protein